MALLKQRRWILLFYLTTFIDRSITQDCRQPQQYEFSTALQVLNITSPNYPNAYPMGTSCRYRLVAPQDHIIELNCQYEVYPNNCGSEIFLISRDGDLQFRDAERFCRTQSIQRRSHFRILTFAYNSRQSSGMYGRFTCRASVRRVNCRCGWSMTSRITNGRETQRNEFPSMVALRDITSTQRMFCGGSIITLRHIVTAAHCIATQPDVSKLLVLAGDHDLSRRSETAFEAEYRILQAFQHPRYNVNDLSMAYDVAVLMTTAMIEPTRGVGPICLPFQQAGDTFAYANVDVTGWGTLSFAGSKSNTLQKAELLIMENSVCRNRFNASITDSQLCTYDYRGRGEDSCQYDSGGPVVLRQSNGLHLVGVISYGRVCGMRYGIGINTRITTHFNWLWSHVSHDVCVLRSNDDDYMRVAAFSNDSMENDLNFK